MATQELKWELTGRRRGRIHKVYARYRVDVHDQFIVCQVEERALSTYAGVTAYETRWRDACPDDLRNETIIGTWVKPEK